MAMMNAIVTSAANKGPLQGTQIATAKDQHIRIHALHIVDKLVAGLSPPHDHLTGHLILQIKREPAEE